MGEMRIPLKLDVKPVKKRPYRLNPKYKEKVKIELDRMLEAGIIEPVEESEWINPMVVQDKKIGEIRICVDLRCQAFYINDFNYLKTLNCQTRASKLRAATLYVLVRF
jgi:hypothetical protein